MNQLSKMKPLAEGYIAGSISVNRASDLVAGTADIARAAASGAISAAVPFGASVAGSHRYKTGSHVDSNGLSAVAGMAMRGIGDNHFTAASFMEFGFGNYSTHNDTASGVVKGDGDSQYIGGGLLEHLVFGRTDDGGHFYLEGSERIGKIKLNYGNRGVVDKQGRAVAYESEPYYYGLHVGTGYVRKLHDNIELDAHCRYFWMHQNGDKIPLDGREMELMSINSYRMQLGLNLSYKSEHWAIHVGYTHERCYDGKARSAIEGIPAIDCPRIGGVSTQLETGMAFHSDGLSIALGVDSSFGSYHGVQGKLRVSYCL
jgi:hypothetical protein